MERQIKERLIGATVLVAAAIILVPEMLSGPEGARRLSPPPTESVKTYSVDLKSLATPAPRSVPPVEEAVMPAAEPESPAEAQELSAGVPEQPPESAEAAAPEPNPVKAAPAPAPAPEAKPVPGEPPVSNGEWAIQVASFSTQAKAATVARDLEKRGFPTFVRTVVLQGKTMYRVRVGPLAERTAAESMLPKVRSHSPAAAIVRNGD